MQSDLCKKSQLRVLSSREGFGLVARCPNGCIHVSAGSTALRFSTQQYWILVELPAEAAQKTTGPRISEHDVQSAIH